MRRYEVAVRGSGPVAAPQGLCSACGRRPDPGTYFRRRHAPFDDANAGEALAKCELPLCEACADAFPLHQRFVNGGAFLAFVGVVIVYLMYGWDRDTESVVHALLELMIPVALALGVGTLLGRGAAGLAGMALPRVRTGNRVAGSARVGFEGWRPGLNMEEHRAIFRFANEEYARAFAAANAARLLPGRGRNAIALPASAPTVDTATRER